MNFLLKKKKNFSLILTPKKNLMEGIKFSLKKKKEEENYNVHCQKHFHVLSLVSIVQNKEHSFQILHQTQRINKISLISNHIICHWKKHLRLMKIDKYIRSQMKAKELWPKTTNTLTPLFSLLLSLKFVLIHICNHYLCLEIQPPQTIRPSHLKVYTKLGNRY